jgi:hypothetical protein
VNPVEPSIKLLAQSPCCGYHSEATPAIEPTALAALALAAHGRIVEAEKAAQWLVAEQSTNGALGVTAAQASPNWPTSLASLVWSDRSQTGADRAKYCAPRDRAIAWLLSAYGTALPRPDGMGHDTTLLGWPWVDGTHSWIEPTAWAVLALKSAGQSAHPRTREAVRLLIDRLLPMGGCNYGNTTVLGQLLRPHVQPSGLALIALVGETDPSGRIALTIDYLQQTISAETTTASLSYALLGLAAQDATPPQADEWIAVALQRTIDRGGAPLQLALGALASLGRESPLITLPRTVTSESTRL